MLSVVMNCYTEELYFADVECIPFNSLQAKYNFRLHSLSLDVSFPFNFSFVLVTRHRLTNHQSSIDGTIHIIGKLTNITWAANLNLNISSKLLLLSNLFILTRFIHDITAISHSTADTSLVRSTWFYQVMCRGVDLWRERRIFILGEDEFDGLEFGFYFTVLSSSLGTYLINERGRSNRTSPDLAKIAGSHGTINQLPRSIIKLRFDFAGTYLNSYHSRHSLFPPTFRG